MDFDMKAVFLSAASGNSGESRLIKLLWQEIEAAYQHENRYYHTMKHLQQVYAELLPLKKNISDWNVILFSLFYHDIIYEPTQQDNESKSAAIAKARLESIHLPGIKIENCMKMIMATKDHTASDDDDINFFTDADLTILGSTRPAYINYCKDVRKEFSELPDFIYKPGRKSVLQHFLEMPAIYKTQYFFDRYENTARENIRFELETL